MRIGVNADYKALVLSGDGDQLAQHRAQLTNIIDLFADNIAAGDIRIGGDGADNAQLLADVLPGSGTLADDRERNAADRCQKAKRHTCFARDHRHGTVHLVEHFGCAERLDKGGVGDLGVHHTALLQAPRDPEELVLKERPIFEIRMAAVAAHLPDRVRDVPVGNGGKIVQRDPLVGRLPLGEHIAVQIDLFEIGKDRLTVL